MAAACSSGSGTPTANEDAGNNAATGGKSSAGGAGSTGGTTAAGGSTSACAQTVLFNFNQDTQGFTLDTSVGTTVDATGDSGNGLPYLNLAAPGDAGVVAVPPELGWSGSQDFDLGAALPGSLTVKAQFSNWNQSFAPQVGGLVDSGGNVIDFTNKIITFHVKITGDGLTPTNNAGGGFVFLKTGAAFIWGQGIWTSITGTNSWTALSINTKSPDQTKPGWDPAAPKQLGIQISSSGGGGTAASPALYGKANNAVIYIDNITVSCAP
jgi:hypothetical protein